MSEPIRARLVVINAPVEVRRFYKCLRIKGFTREGANIAAWGFAHAFPDTRLFLGGPEAVLATLPVDPWDDDGRPRTIDVPAGGNL